ncbi:MAG: DUF6527 family protein [Pseudosphingobacterium sp.]|nr:DUF6527 family protein [Pseudosphingobacterium sp.]
MSKVVLVDEETGEYWFYCPGCECNHRFWAGNKSSCVPNWDFNGDVDKPTISPSHRVIGGNEHGRTVCHSFIKDGQIQYLNDCTHQLKGQTVRMEDFNI